jgi:hypothetical protein
MHKISGHIATADAAKLMAATGASNIHDAVSEALRRAVAGGKPKAAPKAKAHTKAPRKAKAKAAPSRLSGDEFKARMAAGRAKAAKARKKAAKR